MCVCWCVYTFNAPNPKDKNAETHSHPQDKPTACDDVYVSLCLLGMVITLGGVHKFRFNHPAEAAVLRERRRVGAAQLKMSIMLLVKR